MTVAGLGDLVYGAGGHRVASESARDEGRDVGARQWPDDDVLGEGAVERRARGHDDEHASRRRRARPKRRERLRGGALREDRAERSVGGEPFERRTERGHASLQRARLVGLGRVGRRHLGEGLERLERAAPEPQRGHHAGRRRDSHVTRRRVDQRSTSRADGADDGDDRTRGRSVGEPLERAAQGLSLGRASHDEPLERIALGIRHAEIRLGGRVGVGGRAADLAQQLPRARRALARIGREQMFEDAIPRLGQPAPHRRQRRRVRRQHALHGGEARAERGRARPGLEQCRAQPEEICAGRARAREGLGGGVPERAARRARSEADVRVGRSREAEVEQHGAPRGVEAHVRRTHVAVDDAATVQMRERVGELARRALEGDAPSSAVEHAGDAVERGARDELRHDEQAAVVGAADVAHAHDAGMRDVDQLTKLLGRRRVRRLVEHLRDELLARRSILDLVGLGARATPESSARDVTLAEAGRARRIASN